MRPNVCDRKWPRIVPSLSSPCWPIPRLIVPSLQVLDSPLTTLTPAFLQNVIFTLLGLPPHAVSRAAPQDGYLYAMKDGGQITVLAGDVSICAVGRGIAIRSTVPEYRRGAFGLRVMPVNFAGNPRDVLAYEKRDNILRPRDGVTVVVMLDGNFSGLPAKRPRLVFDMLGTTHEDRAPADASSYAGVGPASRLFVRAGKEAFAIQSFQSSEALLAVTDKGNVTWTLFRASFGTLCGVRLVSHTHGHMLPQQVRTQCIPSGMTMTAAAILRLCIHHGLMPPASLNSDYEVALVGKGNAHRSFFYDMARDAIRTCFSLGPAPTDPEHSLVCYWHDQTTHEESLGVVFVRSADELLFFFTSNRIVRMMRASVMRAPPYELPRNEWLEGLGGVPVGWCLQPFRLADNLTRLMDDLIDVGDHEMLTQWACILLDARGGGPFQTVGNFLLFGPVNPPF